MASPIAVSYTPVFTMAGVEVAAKITAYGIAIAVLIITLAIFYFMMKWLMKAVGDFQDRRNEDAWQNAMREEWENDTKDMTEAELDVFYGNAGKG